MTRSRFAPPVVEDAAATPVGDLPRPSFGRTATRQPSYQRFSPGGGREGHSAHIEAGLTDFGVSGPAANDMGPGSEIEALRERARQEGLEEGRALGRQQVQQEAAELLDRYRHALGELEALDANIVEHYRCALVEVAIGVAEAVIQREIERPETVASLARQALDAFGRDVGAIELTLGPDDAQRLDPWLEQRRAAGLDVTVHIDAEAEPGDLRARCPGGALETTLRDRVDRATRTVRGDDPALATDPPTTEP